jgi:hypothetical protein
MNTYATLPVTRARLTSLENIVSRKLYSKTLRKSYERFAVVSDPALASRLPDSSFRFRTSAGAARYARENAAS